MRIKAINGYVLVKRVEENGTFGKSSLSNIFAIAQQDGKHFKKGDKVIIDEFEKTIIDGYVLLKEECILGVVEDD